MTIPRNSYRPERMRFSETVRRLHHRRRDTSVPNNGESAARGRDVSVWGADRRRGPQAPTSVESKGLTRLIRSIACANQTECLCGVT